MTPTTDYRAALAELADELERQANYIHRIEGDDPTGHPLADRARELLAAPEAVGVADEEILAVAGDGLGRWIDTDETEGLLAFSRALLSRYGTAHPAPVPVGERLPELRGMFERTIAVAQASQDPVGHIQLADRLIDAVKQWALPLPGDP
jgi:hypothetical protein